MRNQQLTKALIVMFNTFDKDIREGVLEAYIACLSDYTTEACLRAIFSVMKTCRFIPKPVDLIEYIDETSDSDGLTPEQRTARDKALIEAHYEN